VCDDGVPIQTRGWYFGQSNGKTFIQIEEEL
jgi:hypothetical protein